MPKNSVGDPFSVSLISGSEKVFASEGCHDFVSKFSVSQSQKNSQLNLPVLCSRKFPVAKKVMDKRGVGVREVVSRFSAEIIFISQCRKKS